MHKSASDAFLDTDLAEVLAAAAIKRLVVVGMQSEFCIDATVRAAASRGFDVFLVEDGQTTGDTDILSASQIIAHHNYALSGLANPQHPVTVAPAAAIGW